MVTADGDFGDGGGGWWLVLNHPGLLLALGAVLLVLLVATVIAIWVVVRRLRRSAAVGRGLLQLKAQGLPAGPARELAELRLSLRSATDYTTNSVALAERSGRPVGDLPALVRRLAGLCAELDEQLRLLEWEPDHARLRAALPVARKRTKQVEATATRIRDILGQLEAADTGSGIDELTADVSTEVTALQAGVASLRGLAGGGV